MDCKLYLNKFWYFLLSVPTKSDLFEVIYDNLNLCLLCFQARLNKFYFNTIYEGIISQIAEQNMALLFLLNTVTEN